MIMSNNNAAFGWDKFVHNFREFDCSKQKERMEIVGIQNNCKKKLSEEQQQ